MNALSALNPAQPGTFAWLLAHDLRISSRRFGDLFKGMNTGTKVLLFGAAIVAFHLLAWPAAVWLGKIEAGMGTSTGKGSDAMFHAAMAAGALFVLPWMVAQSLTAATRALYARGDLDLLLASPVSARAVLGARAVAIAFEAVSSVAIFLLPVANMNVLFGRTHWLALYPTLLASGMFGAALGLFIAMGLFIAIGPRRTRLVSQVVATIIGAGFVLGLQVLSVLPKSARDSVMASIDASTPGTIFDRASLLWLPVRASAGDPVAIVLWLAIAASLFALAAFTLGKRFAAGAISSAGTGSGIEHSKRARMKRRPFRTALGFALRQKEMRLIRRDPYLASQLLLQVIYTLPVSVVLWRSQGADGSVALAVAPSLVVIASQISAALAWLAISGEDAPEFLATAPVTRAQIERRKLEAIGMPLGALIALPLLGLAFLSIPTALWTLICCAGAATCTALLNLWHPMPGKRRDMIHRHQQSKLVGLMEHLMSLLWAVAMVMALFGSLLAVIPVLLAMVLLWFNYPAQNGARKAPSHAGLADVPALDVVR